MLGFNIDSFIINYDKKMNFLLERKKILVNQLENEFEKSHIIDHIKPSTEFNFYVQVEREHYHCLLPNELLLIILNHLHTVSLSLVSYQFYMINKDFVSRCYQLHRHIPILNKLIHGKNGIKDKSPNLCVIQINTINYEHKFKLHKFNNTNDRFYYQHEGKFNLFNYVQQITAFDPYVYGKLFTLSHSNFNIEYDYTPVSELNDYLTLSRLFNDGRVKRIIHVLQSLKDVDLFFHELFDCFDQDRQIMMEILNKICIKEFNKSLNHVIDMLTIDKLKEMINGFLKYHDLIDQTINMKNQLYNIINCEVDNHCLFFLNEYKKPLVQLFNCEIPEYQWLADQLK